jgi:exodeoxyribonuclease VII small subunit
MDHSKKSDLPFEEGLKRLSSLVEIMEKGKLSLEDMVKHYQEGTQLLEHCQKQLKSAELKILQLKKSETKSSAPSFELFNE